MPGIESKTWQRCLRDAASGDPDAWGLVRGITVWDLILGRPMKEGHLLALAAPGSRLVGDRRPGQADVGAEGGVLDSAGRELIHAWRLGVWRQTAPWDIANPEVAILVDVVVVFDALEQTPWLAWAKERTAAHLRRLQSAMNHPHHSVPEQEWIAGVREAANDLRLQCACAEPGEAWWRGAGKLSRKRRSPAVILPRRGVSFRTVDDLFALAGGVESRVVQELPEFDLRPASVRSGGTTRQPDSRSVRPDPVYDSLGDLISR